MDLDEDLDGVLDAQMQWAVEKMIVTKLEQEQDRPHLISLPTSIDTPAAPLLPPGTNSTSEPSSGLPVLQQYQGTSLDCSPRAAHRIVSKLTQEQEQEQALEQEQDEEQDQEQEH